jgi:FAD/FMN-containing dehydrogenase
VKEGDEYLERVLLGYGQFGVITKARIKVRPYRPMAVRHFLYTDIGVALADMTRIVEEDAADACAVLTLRDDVIALIVGFEGAVKTLPLRNTPEPLVYAKMAAQYAMRPWKLGDVSFLLRRKADLLPALHDPLFVRDGVVHDRTVVFSRLIWRYWGGPQVVIPDLAITKANFEDAARRGIEVCKTFFPYFTLYAVMIRKFGARARYEMSAIPETSDDHVCGIEFSPLLEGARYSRDHFQRFKNAIYDIDEMVNRHRAMKQALDPSFILNRDVVFDGA